MHGVKFLGGVLMGAAFAGLLWSSSASAQLVSNLNRYSVVTMNVGTEYFGDRTFSITAMPSGFAGLEGIQTANDDKNVATADWITFDLTDQAYVYVAYDKRGVAIPPSWLSDYEDTGLGIGVTDGDASPHQLFRKFFEAGPVSLGGNKQGGGSFAGSNYFVLIEPVPVFSKEPQSQAVMLGQSVTFEAELSMPVAPVSYEWQKDMVATGDTDSTFVINSAQESDEGMYRCVVTDASGAKGIFTTQSALLVVTGGPGTPVAGPLGIAALFLALGVGGAAVSRRRNRVS